MINKKIAFSLMLLVLATMQLNAQVKKVKHVVLIGCDGFGAYALPEAGMPVVKQLMSTGSWSLKARSVLPSSSANNWASMLMGAGTTIHGYTEWDSQTPEIPSAIIKSQKPVLTFVHLSEPDGVGPNIGHKTQEYFAELKNVDRRIGTIVQGVKDAGIEKETIVIITSDHGGVEKGHGGKSLDEVLIPWIINGAGVKSANEISDVIITYDTAATIAYILGLKTPQSWRGMPVRAAFK